MEVVVVTASVVMFVGTKSVFEQIGESSPCPSGLGSGKEVIVGVVLLKVVVVTTSVVAFVGSKSVFEQIGESSPCPSGPGLGKGVIVEVGGV